MYGYFGKYLWLDLTNRNSEICHLDEHFYNIHLGGAGFGARILYDETTSDTDPFGPENV
jgi:aldehyde:ferredoxin oxidoreductase